MNQPLLRVAAILVFSCPLTALAGQATDVEILDRTTGRVLPVYWHEGERHVAGEPGRDYEIRIHNRGHGRLLAVTSVDGINVITGHTAFTDQAGYVVGPQDRVEIDGWRKSMEEVAAFYFTALPDSYAARTGRPDHVGVIGVALFRETRQPAPMADAAASAGQKSADASRRDREESRLGTGHGQRLDSGARYTHFERASEHPEQIIRIYYDSRRNLVARGVIPRPKHRFARRLPDPFPQEFVPDP